MTPGDPQFDVVVLGGGPGGYAAALYASAAGLSVALVERDKVGGTCLHRGCVPAKELLETASVARTVGNAKDYGVMAAGATVDFGVSQARKQKVVDQLHRGLAGLLKGRGVTTVEGTGTLHSDRRVRVSPSTRGGPSTDGPDAAGAAGSAGAGSGYGQSGSGGEAGAGGEAGDSRELTGRNVVVAAGSVPRSIPGFEVDAKVVMTSDEVLSLDRLPASVAVIGGGAIGCEFASMFADLGTQVTVLEALPGLLPGCDEDIAGVVSRSFKKRGIAVHTGVQVHGHAPGSSGTTVSFGDGESVSVEAVVVSVGRKPATEGLLAPGCGVELDSRGFVPVDPWMRTSAEGVWAVGDVVATPQLAHVGFAEAIVAVKGMLGEPVVPVDYGRVPWCIYSNPEVAFAGMTEAAAREAGIDVVVKRDPFGGNSRARILDETDGMVKVVAERLPGGKAGRILGVHMVGPWVTEQLGQGYLAVNWEATPDEVAAFIQPHPTLSESFGETVLALTGRGLHVG